MLEGKLKNYPLTRQFIAWLHSTIKTQDELESWFPNAENLEEALKSLITDEEVWLPDEWQTYIESFLLHIGKFAIEKSYGSKGNFRFIVVPRVANDVLLDDMFLQMLILEMKTRTVMAVAEHDGSTFKTAELERFLSEILEQLQKSRSLLAVRAVTE